MTCACSARSLLSRQLASYASIGKSFPALCSVGTAAVAASVRPFIITLPQLSLSTQQAPRPPCKRHRWTDDIYARQFGNARPLYFRAGAGQSKQRAVVGEGCQWEALGVRGWNKTVGLLLVPLSFFAGCLQFLCCGFGFTGCPMPSIITGYNAGGRRCNGIIT